MISVVSKSLVKSNRLFCDFLDDFIMDVALEAHAEVSRSRALCENCGTRCVCCTV